MSQSTNMITCPTCAKKNTWRTDNPFRPFCSERCKLIDLGAWAAEEHVIPGEDAPSATDHSEDELGK